MTVKNFLISTFNPEDSHQVREPILCADGFCVSVQGGTSFHYCTPRTHCNEYEAVELGFPSMIEPLILEYAEEPSDPTGTVYGWVPIEVVEQVIQKHGGMVASVNPFKK